MEYHNSTLEFNKAFYNSHIKVINSVCKELGCEDKVDELVEKILSKEFIKIKIKKDETKHFWEVFELTGSYIGKIAEAVPEGDHWETWYVISEISLTEHDRPDTLQQ